MKRQEFIQKLSSIVEDDLTTGSVFDDLDNWDSVSMVTVIEFVKRELGMTLTMLDFRQITSVGDLCDKVGL